MLDQSIIDIAHKLASTQVEWCEENHKIYDFQDDFTGMCAIASFNILNEYLLKYKNIFKMEICYNKKHCFNLINDCLVVDATAKQFSSNFKPYVVDYYRDFINGLVYLDINDYWKITRKFKSKTNFIKRLELDYWPENQKPNTYMNMVEV